MTTTQLSEIPLSQHWISGMVISSIGVITGVAHADHLLEDLHTMPVVSSVMFPLCLSVGLLYAGYWLGKATTGTSKP